MANTEGNRRIKEKEKSSGITCFFFIFFKCNLSWLESLFIRLLYKNGPSTFVHIYICTYFYGQHECCSVLIKEKGTVNCLEIYFYEHEKIANLCQWGIYISTVGPPIEPFRTKSSIVIHITTSSSDSPTLFHGQLLLTNYYYYIELK